VRSPEKKKQGLGGNQRGGVLLPAWLQRTRGAGEAEGLFEKGGSAGRNKKKAWKFKETTQEIAGALRFFHTRQPVFRVGARIRSFRKRCRSGGGAGAEGGIGGWRNQKTGAGSGLKAGAPDANTELGNERHIEQILGRSRGGLSSLKKVRCRKLSTRRTDYRSLFHLTQPEEGVAETK